MVFRIGINLGDVMVDGDDIYGDGVNVAARLEKLAQPGGLCISATIFEQVRDRLPNDFDDLGEQSVKNITRPVCVYRVPLDSEAPSPILSNAIDSDTATVPLEIPDRPSVAVLPFTNMSDDKEQEYFSDGITEDIITDLSKVSGLFVIAQNSVFAYKGKSPDLKQVANDLGVRHVLEGSVRKVGERVRITAQLIDGKSGGHEWAERYDRDLQDIFEVQDEVTAKIVAALNVQLTDEERERLTRKDTENLEAYDCLLRGKEHYLRFTRTENIEARRQYEQAIALDLNYAVAYAELARVCIQARNHGWSDAPEELLAEAFDNAKKATELDSNLAQAHIVLGFLHMWNKEHGLAIAEADRGLALDPNNADGQMYMAIILSFAGRPQESVGWVEKAIRLSPGAQFWYYFALGTACLTMQRYDDAVAAYKLALGSNPNFIFSHLCLAASYGHLGRNEASGELAECLRLNPDLNVAWVKEVVPYKDAATLEQFVDGLHKAGLPN